MAGSQSRRSLLRATVGAAGVAALGGLGSTSTVVASDNGSAIKIGTSYSDVEGQTTLNSPSGVNGTLFAAYNAGSGGGLAGSSQSGPGVFGDSNHGSGVRGESLYGYGVYGWVFGTAVAGRGMGTSGAGVFGFSMKEKYAADPPAAPRVGVHGYSEQVNGIGVYGQTVDTTSETYGVHGRATGPKGRAVFGWHLGSTTGAGVFGQSNGASGVGVRGYAWNGGSGSKFGTGVLGSSGTQAFPPPDALPNVGVYGIGVNGHGGVFKGDKAQLRLIPSTATKHPVTGVLGDLFLDAKARLWLCKGGTTWALLG